MPFSKSWGSWNSSQGSIEQWGNATGLMAGLSSVGFPAP